MVKQITQQGRQLARRVVLAQAVVAILLSLLGLLSNVDVALSILLGGMICVVSHGYLAMRAFRYAGARAASEVVSSFYAGEAGKFVLVVIGFTLVFNFVEPVRESKNAAWLFVAYIAVQSVAWFAPLMFKAKQ